MVATAAVCMATYAAPLPAVTRRTVGSDTRTPGQNPNASAARATGIHVPNRTTLCCKRGVSWPGSKANSSSRGKKPT